MSQAVVQQIHVSEQPVVAQKKDVDILTSVHSPYDFLAVEVGIWLAMAAKASCMLANL